MGMEIKQGLVGTSASGRRRVLGMEAMSTPVVMKEVSILTLSLEVAKPVRCRQDEDPTRLRCQDMGERNIKEILGDNWLW